MSSTPRVKFIDSCTRPGCRGGPPGRAITKPIRRRKPSSKRRFKKKAPPLIDDDWTFLAVDQFSKRVQTVQRRGWHLIGSNPTIDVSSSRKKVTVLKAVTHDGETLHFWTEENRADHGVRLLRALLAKFGKKLVVFLDQASYFYAKDVWEFVSGDRSTACVDDTAVKCVQCDALQVWYFPAHLPELNLVEGCWKQLNIWFKYRLIEELSELKSVLDCAQ